MSRNHWDGSKFQKATEKSLKVALDAKYRKIGEKIMKIKRLKQRNLFKRIEEERNEKLNKAWKNGMATALIHEKLTIFYLMFVQNNKKIISPNSRFKLNHNKHYNSCS